MGCGEGFPGWNTKVAFYEDWINCIIEMSDILNDNKEKVEEACQARIPEEINCNIDQENAKCKNDLNFCY